MPKYARHELYDAVTTSQYYIPNDRLCETLGDASLLTCFRFSGDIDEKRFREYEQMQVNLN